ncbi:MAG: ATP-binding cassette domain-containing protein [Anaerolineales bacterium]|nr:ATP-binding cassette domain-containing protein [Anaerolineales bacterium]
MTIIQVRDLRKHFKIPVRKEGRLAAVRNLFAREHTLKVAVDGISFNIDRGEMVGYVGPNGAGKSTTIKMLTGILVPSAGEVVVNGLVPHRDRMRLAHRIGVVFGQKSQLWWDVPVIESLRLLKEIYKIPANIYKANIELFNDLLDLHKFQNTPVRQLSLGQRMRSDLVAALLHNPEILFLDEPTIGVDVVAKDRFRTFIRNLNQERQTTIILTTHDMSDIEKVCARMMIIDEGTIIYDGQVAGMKERFTPYRVLVVDFADGIGKVEIDQAELLKREGQRARFRFNRQKVSASELITRLAPKYRVKDIGVEEPEIEAIVREIYLRSADNKLPDSTEL